MNATTTTAGEPIEIVTRPESIEHHGNGTTTGIVYWKIGEVSFPDNAWNDFIVVIMTWWLKSIGQLVKRSTTSETLRFMDGPFTVICSTQEYQVECQMVDNRKSRPVIEVCWKGSTTSLAMTLLMAAEEVVQTCATLQADNSDIDELKREVENVRSVI